MAAAKRAPSKKDVSISNPIYKRLYRRTIDPMWRRYQAFLTRRPHRSFRTTQRRDLPKHRALPGYVAFTYSVMKVIAGLKESYAIFILLYIIVYTVLVGIVQQDDYSALTDAFANIGPELLGGNFDSTTESLALFGAAVTGGLSASLSEVQQLYVVLLGLFTWLIIVWFLRYRLADSKVRVRDALYNSGAPFIPTMLIGLLLAVQLVPGAIGVLLYSTASAGGILQGGAEAMLFAVGAVLLIVLSLYWATSTFFASLIITIPGTYPMVAIRMAGDIVVGRRITLMLRLLWLAFALLLIWALVLLPIIVIDGAIDIDWLPLVPVTIQILGGSSIMFAATYIYLLYRKMLDEPDTATA